MALLHSVFSRRGYPLTKTCWSFGQERGIRAQCALLSDVPPLILEAAWVASYRSAFTRLLLLFHSYRERLHHILVRTGQSSFLVESLPPPKRRILFWFSSPKIRGRRVLGSLIINQSSGGHAWDLVEPLSVVPYRDLCYSRKR